MGAMVGGGRLMLPKTLPVGPILLGVGRETIVRGVSVAAASVVILRWMEVGRRVLDFAAAPTSGVVSAHGHAAMCTDPVAFVQRSIALTAVERVAWRSTKCLDTVGNVGSLVRRWRPKVEREYLFAMMRTVHLITKAAIVVLTTLK